MAEIRVEKKSPMWPWILIALLVLGVIIYFLFFHDANGAREDPGDAPVVTEMTGGDNDRRDGEAIENQTVVSYVSYVRERDAQMGLDHEFTNEAFKRLVDATEAMADEVDHDIDRDLDMAREHAQHITEDPFETTHANRIRMAADKLADALQNLQQAEFPNLSNQAQSVKQAASEIDPAELTLDQRDAVKSYFDEAADLLEQMNN
ncbi:hypothetical protein [Litoribacter populi]|uniref:hypothetical protein n=1 Tax=Litoribacter populi TaxID=2598460 RepID=UPI00117DB479|nr:hypothetical protein [Litoribacter populi]